MLDADTFSKFDETGEVEGSSPGRSHFEESFPLGFPKNLRAPRKALGCGSAGNSVFTCARGQFVGEQRTDVQEIAICVLLHEGILLVGLTVQIKKSPKPCSKGQIVRQRNTRTSEVIRLP